MKLIHIGDIHLGKTLHQYSLLEIQKELLFQIVEYIKCHDIDGVIIAGDIYDQSIPPQEAVKLLDSFLSSLIHECHVNVYMIPGNHDSAQRLSFGASLLESTGLYIETGVYKTIPYIEKEDVRFYLLPFVKPLTLKHIDENTPTDSYQSAFSYYMSQQTLDTNYKNILVAHQFVGRDSITSDSENTIIGGTEIIESQVFEHFDYVALGHLHEPQYVNKKHIVYSGSLMPYSFDEKHKKSFVVLDTDTMTYERIPLVSTGQVISYKGYYQDFIEGKIITNKDDLISIEFLDNYVISHAIDHLRDIYPHILRVSYPELMNESYSKEIENIQHLSHYELFLSFYEDMTSHSMNEHQETIIKEVLEDDHETS